MIKAIVFDIDGTLIDSNRAHAEAFAEAFEKFGKRISSDDLVKLIGMGADKILEKYLTTDEIKAFGEDLTEFRKKLFLEKYLPDLRVFPKHRELLEKIKNNRMQIALASSASEEELEEYEKLLKISDLLAAETSSDDAEESKPDPDIFLAAFGKLKNVEKNEALIVGDTPYDAEAGRKAGIKVIGVLSGGWSREKLADAGCLEVFQDIAEIFEQFDQIIKGKSRTITSLG